MDYHTEKRVREISNEGGCLAVIFVMAMLFLAFCVVGNIVVRHAALEKVACEQANICLPENVWRWPWNWEPLN